MKSSLFDKIQLWLDDENVTFTEKEQEMKDRIFAVFSVKIRNPTWSDHKVARFITKKWPVTESLIMKDCILVESMIGKTRAADKRWVRFFIGEVCKKAIDIAEKNGDAYAMAHAAGIMGKYNLADKEDKDEASYDDITPFIPEITTDISILGLKPIPQLEQKKSELMRKYGLNKVTEAEIIQDESAQAEDIHE